MEPGDCAGILHIKEGEEYYIIKEIGEGATSHVYLCQSVDNYELALKLYRNDEAFHTETELLGMVQSSKNIVKLIKSGEAMLELGQSLEEISVSSYFKRGPVKFGLFEYLPNGELFEYVNATKEGFSEKICKIIFKSLLDAVEACHISGVVHGDIKLENILLSENFEIKLIDFGFSKALNNGELIYQCSGTKCYSAPETNQSEAHGYDGIKNDIFSMGVVLFILFFGYPPFVYPTFSDYNYKLIINKDYDTFWKIVNKSNITISETMKDLIHKMLCFDGSSRISIEEIKTHPWVAESFDNDNCDMIVETESDINDIYKKEFIKRKEIIEQNKKDFL